MTNKAGPTNLWGDHPREQRRYDPSVNRQGEHQPRRSGERNWFKTIFTVALLAAAAWAAWHYGAPMVAKFRSSDDIEQCAVKVLKRLPGKVASEQELRGAIDREVQESLTSHFAFNARWYVCFGPRGADVRVVRDDKFDKSERAFVERLIDEARLKHDVEGVQHDVFTYPLGASYTTITVDGHPWCVAVGWSEKK